MVSCVLLVLLSISLQHCSTKVIVFFPAPTTSHVRDATNVARATTHYGHTAWVCIPHYLMNQDRVDRSGINTLVYGETLGNVELNVSSILNMNEIFWSNQTQPLSFMVNAMFFIHNTMSTTLEEGFIDKVAAVNPDLFVIDGVPFLEKIYVVPYALDVPYAVFGAMHDVLGYRIPFSPAATPLQLVILNDQMSFTERLYSTLSYFIIIILPCFIQTDGIASQYAPGKPHKTLNDLAAGAEIYITELDPIMDYPRPTLPNVKMVGGTVARDANPLKDPFKSFLNESTKGAILITFGSMSMVDIPRSVFDKMNAACLVSGMNIVWKSEETSPDPKRILTSKWLPQNDILGHENTQLFISHCGKNGQYESLYHGVPILCLPISSDQPYNAERIRAKGYGLKADIRFTSTEELSEMVRELLTNSSYKTNMVKASELFRLFYKSPMNESAFWLDHVMQYGGDYMRAASQRMPYYQFLMLDVLAVLFLVTTLGFVILYTLVCVCLRVVCRSKTLKVKSE